MHKQIKSKEKMCDNIENSLNPIFKKMHFYQQGQNKIMYSTRSFTSVYPFLTSLDGNWWEESEGAQKSYRPQDDEEIVSEDFNMFRFRTAVIPTNIKIYERHNPGAIVRILGTLRGDRWYLLYEGPPEKCSVKSRIFYPKLRLINNYIQIIQLEYNHSQHDYHYTYIDGVTLLGYNGRNKVTKCQLSLSKNDVSLEEYGESSKIKKPKKENYFNMLPDEIIIRIFDYLDLQSMTQCASVCKKWNNLSRDSSFCQKLNLKKYWFKVNDKSLRCFQYRCTNLKKLDLSCCYVNEGIFIDFMKKCCKHLTHLSLCHCRFVQSKAIREISNCSELIDLRLRNCSSENSRAFSLLSKLTKLQTLDLYKSRITNDALTALLKANKNLKHLNIDTDSLSLCTQLKELNTGYSYLLPYDLETLGHGCRDLRRLSLACSYRLDDESILPIIKSCKQLTHLDLFGIDDITADICEIALSSLPKLRFLNVSDCNNVQKEKIEFLQNIYPDVTIRRNQYPDEPPYYAEI